jgi:hypothetical protein
MNTNTVITYHRIWVRGRNIEHSVLMPWRHRQVQMCNEQSASCISCSSLGKEPLVPVQQDATDSEMVWMLCKGEVPGPCWKQGTIPQLSRPQPSHHTDSPIPALYTVRRTIKWMNMKRKTEILTAMNTKASEMWHLVVWQISTNIWKDFFKHSI